MATTDTVAGTASRRSRRTQRGRRSAPTGDLLANVTQLIDQLILENRQLKRALARAEKSQGPGDLGQAARTLAGLQRRLSRALDGADGSRRGRSAAAPAPKPRRKVTDPEVLERRRAALAKARAARAAKRQAARQG